ncbi:CPBP family intramembrane glutamic endopeptidase [Clostridium brassicae]|uniref:Type II CAAX endopeptidase family protein n=1 Tax=Clostridium brassicae TaxID=2999072 RepID=A0ABT4DEF2_9CLOT|nr:type II CAAX endopeptidase family protein [Clostridium brassicae]MCY6960700.1 type II CAAX endopeptidase family protein [Clostridium brassicae]
MIFRNKNNEIRSGFKIIAFSFIYLIFVSTFTGAIGGLVGGYISARYNSSLNYNDISELVQNYMQNSSQGLLISQVLSILALFITLFIVLKLFQKRKFEDIGLNSIKKNSKNLFYGMIFGAISIIVISVVLMITGNIKFQNSFRNPQFNKNTLIGIFLFILVAINEETLCRGYIFTTLNQMDKPWLSAVMSSAFFAALHLLNPNVNLIGILNIFLVGMLFCFMYVRTKSLWMPIGFHFTWNYFQGNVFGFPVSGISEISGIYNIAYLKENILTGGFFGPEAGIIATIVLILNFILLNKRKKRVNKGRL